MAPITAFDRMGPAAPNQKGRLGFCHESAEKCHQASWQTVHEIGVMLGGRSGPICFQLPCIENTGCVFMYIFRPSPPNFFF